MRRCAASRSTMWKRSDSKPGRSIARYARSPFCQEHRLGVPGRLACVRLARRGVAVDGGLDRDRSSSTRARCPGDARRRTRARAVGAECELLVAAEGLRGHVRIESLDTSTGSARAIRLQARDEQCERVPLLHVSQWRTKSLLKERTLVPAGLPLRSPPLRASSSVSLVHCSSAHSGTTSMLPRCDRRAAQLDAADVERIIRHLRRLFLAERDPPHLGASRAVREKIDRAAVGRPART